LATTITGWLFASFRGWSISLFYLVPLPMLASKSEANVKAFDGWHQAMGWTLLVLIGIHVATAMVHIFIYRDRIMQRMHARIKFSLLQQLWSSERRLNRAIFRSE